MGNAVVKVAPFDKYTAEYEAWFDCHDAVFQSELSAIREHMQRMHENVRGIEIGVGSGRYAVDLGIKEGVEPSENMRMLAGNRGIEVIDARAEDLPYKDYHFDFVLFVTICHLENFSQAVSEAKRVLKPGGVIIVGFLDKNKTVAKSYDARRNESKFYKYATFYPAEKVIETLKKHAFKELQFMQTLFGDIDTMDVPEAPRKGYTEGSYVVVSAVKKK